jgi:hypothetical protein
LNTVIFKDSAAATTGKKFFSLFPGLGYAAGYKVDPDCFYNLAIPAYAAIGSAKSLQVWRTTLCPRLPSQEPRQGLRRCFWPEDWKGYDAFMCRKVGSSISGNMFGLKTDALQLDRYR